MTLETDGIRGVTKNYGARKTDMKWGGRTDTDALIKLSSWTFDYNDLPDAANHNLGQSIPAGSTIVSARMRIITAFTSTSGTTDLLVGLEQADGTVIDADGLIAAAQATQTAIGTAGNMVTGAGALVGVSIGANAGELVVAPNVADLTAGRAEVLVEYMIPAALPA